MDPYALPDGNVQICFSGGRTSGYMLHEILEANGGLPDRCKVLFANTGREMPETLDFVQACSDRWNVPIVWLEYNRRDGKVTYDIVSHNSAARNGEPFTTLTDSTGILPNIYRRFCTSELKVLTAKRYLVKQGWKQWTQCLGIRGDERRRVKTSTDKRWENWYPLNDANVSKRDVMAFWQAQPFDLQLANINGSTPLGNCDGCFLKSEANRAALARDYPERFKWWADLERNKTKELGKRAAFDADQTYEQLASFVDRQGDWIFDDEEYLCQQNEGECTG